MIDFLADLPTWVVTGMVYLLILPVAILAGILLSWLFGTPVALYATVGSYVASSVIFALAGALRG